MMKRRFNGAGGRKAALLLSGIAMTTMLGGCVQVAHRANEALSPDVPAGHLNVIPA